MKPPKAGWWLGAGIWWLTGLLQPAAVAAAVSGVDEAVYYEIVYNTGAAEAKTIKRAKIVDVLQIGARQFLVIESPSTNNPLKGYVSLEAIRSILPPGSFSSER